MSITRKSVADIALSWKGLKETDGSFKPIIDIYNSIEPLPRNYRLKYTDAWGPGTVSAAYHQAGASNIFPCECSCDLMIDKAQLLDIWVEGNCGYVPKIADVCAYTTEDSNIADHVGIVVSINKKAKAFEVVEGNMASIVGTRTLSVKSKFVKGFIAPIFDEDFAEVPQVRSATKLTVDISANTNVSKLVPDASVTTIKNTVVGTGTLSKVAAGSNLKLNQTPMYASPSTSNVSCYKTGTYYIWSVDTINGRVRITNSKSYVGVQGQVTGWIDVATALALMAEPPTTSVSALTPNYQVNAVYIVQIDDLVVRQGPGTSYDKVGYSGLTANAKKYDKTKSGCLTRNAKVTCLEVKIVGSNVWMRIPSGWVAAYYDKKYNVK